MTPALKPYSPMKDSGVDWFGEIPEHWGVRRLRTVSEMRVSNVDKHSKEGEVPVRLCNYVDVYYHDRIHPGMPFLKATATPEDIRRFRLQRDDVLITKDSEAWDDIGVPALVVDGYSDLLSGYHLALLRPHIHLMAGGYLFRALECPSVAGQLHVSANGVTRYGLSHSSIKSTLLPLPPVPEQAAIARFLDHMDRRIQKYINAKEKLIALLDEYKQALIHQAVTGQIDVRTGEPYGEYKESGVEWFSKLPTHWEVRRLKSLIRRIDQGVSPQAENRLADGDSWGVLKAGCVNGGVFQARQHKRLPEKFEFGPALAVSKGDVLVSRASGSPNLVGSVGLVTSSRYKLILSDKTFRPVFNRYVDSDFMVMAMNSRYYRKQVSQAISGAEGLANNLPVSALQRFVFAMPSVSEQHEIATSAQESTGRIDDASACAAREASLMREYRTRLFADVVTGKIDACEAAARLPNLDPVGDDRASNSLNPSDSLGLDEATAVA